MTAPVLTYNTEQLHYDGPGLILAAVYSPTLTLPTFAATASVFTNDWDAAWTPIGLTDTGFQMDFTTATTTIEAAELQLPVATVVTSKTASLKFSMMQDNKFNLARAMNGGTFTVTGSAGTKVTKYSPPVIGGELRTAIAWISSMQDESIIVYKTFQTGSLSIQRQKLGTKWVLACDFAMEQPDQSLSTDPWNRYYAGTKLD